MKSPISLADPRESPTLQDNDSAATKSGPGRDKLFVIFGGHKKFFLRKKSQKYLTLDNPE